MALALAQRALSAPALLARVDDLCAYGHDAHCYIRHAGELVGSGMGSLLLAATCRLMNSVGRRVCFGDTHGRSDMLDPSNEEARPLIELQIIRRMYGMPLSWNGRLDWDDTNHFSILHANAPHSTRFDKQCHTPTKSPRPIVPAYEGMRSR